MSCSLMNNPRANHNKDINVSSSQDLDAIILEQACMEEELASTSKHDPRDFLEQGNLAVAEYNSSGEQGLNGEGGNYYTLIETIRPRLESFEAGKKVIETNIEEEGLNVSKKEEHNAKERVRRLKLHVSYIALGSLIPDPKPTKKRWSAPAIIDRVIDYIPGLENEINKLTVKRNNLLSIQNKRVEKEYDHSEDHIEEEKAPKFMANEVKEGEVVIQVFLKRSDHDQGGSNFSNLIEKLQVEEHMTIESASTVQVGGDKVCCHLHVKMEKNSLGGDYVQVLRQKLKCWLC